MRARGPRCPRAGEGHLGSGLPLLLKNSRGTAQVTPTDPDSRVASSRAREKQLSSPCTDGDTAAQEALASGGAPACQRPARLCALLNLRTALRGRLLPSLLRGRANPLSPALGAYRAPDSRPRARAEEQMQTRPQGPGSGGNRASWQPPPPPPTEQHTSHEGLIQSWQRVISATAPPGGSPGIPISQAHSD